MTLHTFFSKISLRSIAPHIMILLVVMTSWIIIPDSAEAQRKGGSFGGSRSSGSSRGYSAPRSGGSFGGSRAPRSGNSYGGGSYNSSRSGGSFGSGSRSGGYAPSYGTSSRGYRSGTSLQSSSDYTSRYGTPRKQETRTEMDNGTQRSVTYNNYGGYGDGLMMGYMMGTSSWMWSMPFHPAYYYSRPATYIGQNGTVEVYPPTFSFMTLFMTLLVVGLIVFIIYIFLKSRRRQSSSLGTNYSSSSFG